MMDAVRGTIGIDLRGGVALTVVLALAVVVAVLLVLLVAAAAVGGVPLWSACGAIAGALFAAIEGRWRGRHRR